jgi:hypothetical protein
MKNLNEPYQNLGSTLTQTQVKQNVTDYHGEKFKTLRHIIILIET